MKAVAKNLFFVFIVLWAIMRRDDKPVFSTA
jgi:hypothetical protein